jgi:UDP-GlcNAc3NAcA epimerase
MPIVLPLHPRTKKMLGQNGIDLPSNVRIIDPVGYLDMITLQRHASVIGTDSGGLQKEAYFQGVPCVTFRDETEWTELVEMGANTLVGADASLIADSMANAKPITDVANIYGDGNASQLIADALFLAGNRN